MSNTLYRMFNMSSGSDPKISQQKYSLSVGNTLIPLTVTTTSTKKKRIRKNRRNRGRRTDSMSSAYDGNAGNGDGGQKKSQQKGYQSGNHGQSYQSRQYWHNNQSGQYSQIQSSGKGKDGRKRTESIGVYSTTSRGTNGTTSRRGWFYGGRSGRGSIGGTSSYNQRWDRDRLSRQIWEYYENHCQTRDLMTRKTHLKEALLKIITTNFSDQSVSLYIVGSSANGLGNNTSDMDICLVLKPKPKEVPDDSLLGTLDELKKEENEEAAPVDTITTTVSANGKSDPSIPMLEKIRDVLQCYDFVEKLQIILAKVPIVKFIDRISGIEVTLNVNKLVSIRNTLLIRDYTKMDWRLQPLVMVIKAWAKDHGIKDAYNKSISSYSLVLMIIHYLQYGCDPPVLPCLQRMDPDRYAPDADIKEMYRRGRRQWTRKWRSHNNSTLKELFVGFLDYFSYDFCYDTDAISIRLGHVIPKNKIQPLICPYLCIEEPFIRTNTAHSVYDRVIFDRILSVFRVSHYTLRRYPFLGSIMPTNR